MFNFNNKNRFFSTSPKNLVKFNPQYNISLSSNSDIKSNRRYLDQIVFNNIYDILNNTTQKIESFFLSTIY